MSFETIVSQLRSNFSRGVSRDLSWRKRQLAQLQKVLQNHQEEFVAALKKDLNKPKQVSKGSIILGI